MKNTGMPCANRTESCGDVLPRIMSFLNCEKEYQKQSVFFFWEQIVGRDIALHVRPVRMDFRTLYLSADAPVWANELRYMERDLIDKINAFACAELVKEIRFGAPWGIGKNAPPERETEAAETAEPVRRPTAAEKKLAEEKTSFIEDDALREAVSRAMAQSLAKKREQEDASYHPCAGCGRLIPPEERRCPDCERERRDRRRERIRAMFRREPWLHPGEVRKILGYPIEDIVDVYSALLREMTSEVEYGDETSENARRLVMMFAHVRPEALTKEIMERSLKKLRFDLLYAEEKMPKAAGVERWREEAAKRFASRRKRRE